MSLKNLKEDFFLFIFENCFFDFQTMKILNIVFEILILEEKKHYFLRGFKK